MRLPPNEYAIETPLALLILILVLTPLIFFGVRYGKKVRAQAKRESSYQAAQRSYKQVLKPGMKRMEVEDYLRLNGIEFVRLSLDDITKIGEDEAPNWFCGKPSVYLQFQFNASTQRRGLPDEANERDPLDEIKILRTPGACL